MVFLQNTGLCNAQGEEDSTHELEEIVVTATHKTKMIDTPASISIITARELEEMGAKNIIKNGKENKMVYQNLVLGILFSIGLFAVKSGVGIHYFISVQSRMRHKTVGFLLFALTYFIIFSAIAFILAKIDIVGHLVAIQTFIKSGMLIHLIMAGMLMVWGVILLKRDSSNSQKSKGWMLLAVPCPVCLIVIFFSAGFLITCFPDTPKTAVLILYFVFILINLITIAILTRLQHKRKIEPEFLLGAIMLLIAVYFFISVTVMPQFADIDTIYRMAQYKGTKPAKEVVYRIPFIIFTVLAFVGGYSFRFKKIRSIT